MPSSFPFFLECSEYTLDEFWKNIFINCSKNKFPKNVVYKPKDNSLTIYKNCRTNRNNISIINIPEDEKNACKMLIKVFKDIGLQSPCELKMCEKELEEYKEEKRLDFEDCVWTDIKQKHIKGHIIFQYAQTLKDELNLSNTEVKQLLGLIRLGLQFKNILSTDIIINKGEIKNIDNLEWNKDLRQFELVKKEIVVSSKNKKKEKSIDEKIQNFWKKRK